MHKILFVFTFVSTLVHALYNPFFVEDKPRENKKVQEKVIYEKKDVSKRKTIVMTYFGYVSSSKGKFALVRFNKKNIVISQNDRLYHDEEMFKIGKITSNYILLKDKQNRVQTVYFSSSARVKRQYNE